MRTFRRLRIGSGGVRGLLQRCGRRIRLRQRLWSVCERVCGVAVGARLPHRSGGLQ